MAFGDMPAGFSVRPYEARDRDAVRALQEKQREGWLKKGVDVPMGDPDDPQWVATVVVVDGKNVPIICMGARKIVEIGMTIDADRLELRPLMSALARAWARLAWMIYRQGITVVLARVTSPTPGWANMLVRRGKFSRSDAPHAYIDLEETLGGFLNNVQQ